MEAPPRQTSTICAGQISERLREGFGGRALWKASLGTHDPREAAELCAEANAELERCFAAARDAVEQTDAKNRLTLDLAASLIEKGLRRNAIERYPVLTLIYWAEEARPPCWERQRPGSCPCATKTA